MSGERLLRTSLFFLLITGLAHAQEVEKLTNRYGYAIDARNFPQGTPQEAMKSIVKAVGEDRFDYLLAQLADPRYVDARVAEYRKAFTEGSTKGRSLLAFRRLVKETSNFYREEPALVREMRQFAREAEWEIGDEIAVGSLKQLAGRNVIFRKYEERWFLDNKQKK